MLPRAAHDGTNHNGLFAHTNSRQVVVFTSRPRKMVYGKLPGTTGRWMRLVGKARFLLAKYYARTKKVSGK